MAVTAPVVGAYVAPQPPVMVWPAGRVKPSFQPLTVVVPLLVMVTEAVRPVFQAFTVAFTRQAPGCGWGAGPERSRPKKVSTRDAMPWAYRLWPTPWRLIASTGVRSPVPP